MSYTYDDNTASDLAKDAFGTRRALPLAGNRMSPEEKQSWWDYAQNEVERQLRQEAQEEALVLKAAMDAGATDRETALRWIEQAEYM